MRPALQPRSNAPARYPIGTVAAYGPTSTVATKLVASVLERPGRDPSVMKTWIVEASDVRGDAAIANEVAAFLKQHHVRDTVDAGRIIGCPHEEGIDYPMGRACPQCPFWAGIDRFTHEPVTVPTPTMSPEEILEALSVEQNRRPLEALASADGHRETLVPFLFETLERGLANPIEASPETATLSCYALYLLAK